MQELRVKHISQGLSYSRTAKLGEGAFGQVFLGFDDSRKVPCAFKIVNLQKLTLQIKADTLMKKMKDEIVNMQISKHPSLIQFYQAKQSPNHIYILCEYCNGQSLDQFIKKRQYMTQWEVVLFFRQILQGFYQLRKNNIVHRDLKPANLLLHNFSIKIGDLGFSKATDNHEQMLTSIVGTPLYMSPQIFQQEQYSEKTDIWSLGVILYEMLYGRNPFAGSKNLYQLKQRVKKQIIFPDAPVVSHGLKKTIKRMLKVCQKDRISWQSLFQQYLSCDLSQLSQSLSSAPPRSPFQLSLYTANYFRVHLYLESYLQLPKIAKDLALIGQEQFVGLGIGKYGSKEEFYKEVLFETQNRGLIQEFYGGFIQKRNQVVFTVQMVRKMLQLVALKGDKDQLLGIYIFCSALLGYKYSLTLLSQLTPFSSLLIPSPKYHPILPHKQPYNHLLLTLLLRDQQLIKQELKQFQPHFMNLLDKIQMENIGKTIQKQLSGIYGNQEGEKRVIRLFYCNWIKKIYNHLKNNVQIPKVNLSLFSSTNSMVDQNQQQPSTTTITNQKQKQQNPSPPLQVQLLRMINQYLTNSSTLFLPYKQKGTKNMIQHMYDWQTSVKQQFYLQLQQSQPMEEESIDSFLKKEFLMSKIYMSGIGSNLHFSNANGEGMQ